MAYKSLTVKTLRNILDKWIKDGTIDEDFFVTVDTTNIDIGDINSPISYFFSDRNNKVFNIKTTLRAD